MPAGRGVTIRAAVSHGVGVPPSIEDLQLNAPNPNEVRVEITACAVCHSDLSYLDGTWATDFPLVLGHEATGYVVELGESGNEYGGNGSDLAVGDPVVITLIRSCGICRACRRGHDVACTGEISLNRRSPLADTAGNRIIQGLNVGAFAEQVVVHRSQVVKLPDDVDPVAACLLGCGVLTGYGAVANTAQVAAGDAVVVVGCGGVGSGALQAARIQSWLLTRYLKSVSLLLVSGPHMSSIPPATILRQSSRGQLVDTSPTICWSPPARRRPSTAQSTCWPPWATWSSWAWLATT